MAMSKMLATIESHASNNPQNWCEQKEDKSACVTRLCDEFFQSIRASGDHKVSRGDQRQKGQNALCFPTVTAHEWRENNKVRFGYFFVSCASANSAAKIRSSAFRRSSNIELIMRWKSSFSSMLPTTPNPISYSTSSPTNVPSRPSMLLASNVCV